MAALTAGITPEAKLEKAGLIVASSKETLAAIAEANGMAAERRRAARALADHNLGEDRLRSIFAFSNCHVH